MTPGALPSGFVWVAGMRAVFEGRRSIGIRVTRSARRHPGLGAHNLVPDRNDRQTVALLRHVVAKCLNDDSVCAVPTSNGFVLTVEDGIWTTFGAGTEYDLYMLALEELQPPLEILK